MSKKISPERLDKLIRDKKSSPESKFQWLQSALEFARVEKKIKRKND